MTIYKTEMYTDDANRNIVSKEDINSDEVSLIGSVLIKTKEQGHLPIEFPFEDKSLTVQQAFEVFDETLQAFVTKKKEEQSNIIVPQNSGDIIAPTI
jgi:hypothetical protein